MSAEILGKHFEAGELAVFDGAGGTTLTELGYTLRVGGAWSAEALLEPRGCQLIGDVHDDFIVADYTDSSRPFVLTTFSYRTHRLGEQAEEATLRACELAHESVERCERPNVIVAGSVGSIGDSHDPETVPSDEVLEDEHERQIDYLARGEVDLVLGEAINNWAEAESLIEAAQATGIPVAITFACTADGKYLLSGEPLEVAVALAYKLGVVFSGIQCVNHETATRGAEHLQVFTTRDENDQSRLLRPPLIICAQGYDPSSTDRLKHLSAKEYLPSYLSKAKRWIGELGIQGVGACCGGGPPYVRGVSELVFQQEQVLARARAAAARKWDLLSRRQPVDWRVS